METDFLHVFIVELSRISVTVSLLLMFLGLLYWYSVYPFSVLSRCGIKHPKPVPFFGNLLMLRQGFFKPLTDLVKTHGRVSGYYFGRKPVVVIADPDMLRQVLIKDFSNFTNRMSRVSTKPWEDCLLMLRDERWRRVRNILTPTFSAAKMKEMVPLIDTTSDVLMNNLNVHAESGEAFDIYKCFGCFTMDAIASVAFGTHVDSQKNPKDPFVRNAQIFTSMSLFRPIMLLNMLFPAIMYPLASLIPNKKRKLTDSFFIRSIKEMIKLREEQSPDQAGKEGSE
ncbi:thromboxane-A synthase [Nematolebias whitei]|uniref:thromboxane-A synthase n=1 Tax=Nematolebias whitei TaxID=451745 RepID=UPI00189B0E24|nr:thromboxane-A synthase [Nematolebias whitei]